MTPDPAPTGAYWNAPATIAAFSALPPPDYLTALLARHRAPTPRTSLALDAGCGAGRNLPALLAAGYRVLAADLHPGILDQARRHTQPGLALIQADLARLPLRDQAASVIVCHGVLHNLPDHTLLAAALHELRRVLAPGGVLSLNTFTADYLDPCLQDLGADIYRLPNGQHMTLLDSGRLRELLRHTGLSVQGTPAQYLRPGDPGQRSVWRATLTHP